jgi:carboxylesterase type B
MQFHFLTIRIIPGASHGDDIGYLFHMFHHEELHMDPEDECMKVSTRMVKMWTNFAKTG